MAYNFLKKPAAAAPAPAKSGLAALSGKKKPAPKDDDSASDDSEAKVKTPNKAFGWMKTGAKAKQAFETEEARAAAQAAEADKMWRFFLKPDEDAKITFLDGELDEEGMLDILTFYEHFIMLNGKPRNFICTDDTEPCPICEGGKSTKSLVGVMTVLDHRKHKIQNGPNAGKIIVNDRKLFVAKRGTLKMLTKIAIKREGLAGCSFDVSRGNDKSPNVGNVFDFTNKFESFDEIAGKFEIELAQCMPADYKEELTYYTADELVALGVGKAMSGPGYGGGGFGSKSKVSAKGMADKL